MATPAEPQAGASGDRGSRPASRANSIRNIFRSRNGSASSVHHDAESVASEESMVRAIDNLDANQKRYFEVTCADPMGKILVSLYKDNLNLAERTGVNEMASTLGDLCKSFHDSLVMQKENKQKELLEAAAHIQQGILEKELNSHLLHQDFKPPEFYSPVPTLLTTAQRAEAMRVFPVRGQKFSGSGEGPNVLEFLSNMRSAQQQCKLSEKEFTEFLLLCTTGYAHMLLVDWLGQNERVDTLFHNLLIYFDRRISPEEARVSLAKIRAQKGGNLNKLISKILSLASRACSVLPPGEAQAASFNNEAITALIRSLPNQSSLLAQSQFNILSAKLGRPCSFTELTRALNVYRHQINEDINKYGAESEKYKNGQKGKWNGKKKVNQQYTSYATNVNPNEKGNTHQQGKHFNKGNGGYKPNNQGQSGGNWKNKGKFNKGSNGKNWGQYNGNKQNKGQGNLDYCSLCGFKDHRASDNCPFMVADNGRPVHTLPTLGTCKNCPPEVNPRLNHPFLLCPYRPSGPLHQSS